MFVERPVKREMILDVAVPRDGGHVNADKEKQIKYVDLAHKIIAMWKLDYTIVV